MDALIDLFASAQEGLFETFFQPLAFAWGFASRLENVYEATGWLLIGLLQIAVMLTVIGPLQRWRPAEAITNATAVRTDVLYTLIHRLGLFQLVLFFSVHHSQRHMTQWSDNRNHLLDDLLRAVIWVVVAQLVGIAPSQFVAVVALTQLSENFQHGNLRLSFGRIGERLWVSPRFHRLHHAIGLGHESLNSEGQTVLGGHNFGVLLPCWDMLFRTANFDSTFEATGIRDQVTEGRDYGKGFISQQILGIKRLLSALGLSSHT